MQIVGFLMWWLKYYHIVSALRFVHVRPDVTNVDDSAAVELLSCPGSSRFIKPAISGQLDRYKVKNEA